VYIYIYIYIKYRIQSKTVQTVEYRV
jgi:hypothetical protein